MKKTLLALAFIAALPGCGCFRKCNSESTKATKSEKDMSKEPVKKEKDMGKKKMNKEHMDMDSSY